MKFSIAFVLLCIAGCGASRRAAPEPQAPDLPEEISLDGLTSLEVSPPSAQTTTRNGMAGESTFAAIGHFADGHSADVSRAVVWSLGEPSLGQIVEGKFSTGSSPTHGGETIVTASGASQSAQATLIVKYQIVRVSTDDGSTVAADADTAFASATQDATLAPIVVYPNDQTRVPSNLNDLEIQWRYPAGAGFGNGLIYEVSIDHPHFGLKVYTNAPLNGGSHYSLLPSEWTALAATIKDESVLVSVAALSSGRAGRSTPIRLDVAAAEVHGGIYYWSNPGTASAPYQPGVGVIRREFGDPTAQAQPFYTGASANTYFGSSGHCVGCHYLSRDGKKMSISYDGVGYAMLDVATKAFMTAPPGTQSRVPFVSFAPDSNRAVMHTDDYASLAIFDTSGGPMTGTLLETLPTAVGAQVTHPDWSPDGKQIVYVESPGGYPWDRAGGSLKIISTDADGKFTQIRTLLERHNENNYYPTFSPDGQWILFNRSDSNDSAYDATDAEIWVIPADGSREAIKLTFANGEPMRTNSWPRWTPFVQTYGKSAEPLYYFTFSSKRDYGLQLVGMNRAQIWMASFNPLDLSTGIDSAGGGSSAAFWVPFQDPATSNHNAQWVETIVPSIN